MLLAKFLCSKWPNIEKLQSHLDTLTLNKTKLPRYDSGFYLMAQTGTSYDTIVGKKVLSESRFFHKCVTSSRFIRSFKCTITFVSFHKKPRNRFDE